MYPAALFKKGRFVREKFGMITGLENGAAGFIVAPVVRGVGRMQLPHNSGDGDIRGFGKQMNAAWKQTVGVKVELCGVDYFS